MAVFYLLLSTGMFVCIVHCSAESLICKSDNSMAGIGMSMHCHKKCCNHTAGGTDSGCSKQHGTFVIKENLKPGFELQFLQTGALNNKPITAFNLSSCIKSGNRLFAEGKAPPGKSGKWLSINFHSLQI